MSASYAPAFRRMPGHIVFGLCIRAYMLMYICPSVRDPVSIFVTGNIKFYSSLTP